MDYKHNLKFVTSEGNLEMNSSLDIKVLDIQGVEGTHYTINKTDSQADGQNFNSMKIEPREITIYGDIAKNDNEIINREKLISFFNPKIQGTLFINHNDIKRKASYRVSAAPKFETNKMADYIQFTIELECVEEPYLEDTQNSGGNLTEIIPQFAFPLAICPTKIMGYKRYKDFMVINNKGDKESGVIIKVTAKDNAEGIKLTLNDDEYIYVDIAMVEGDVLIINTNPRKKSVTLNGENIINKIDRYSTFFSVKKGKNRIAYEVDEGSSNLDIEVDFYAKFLGV